MSATAIITKILIENELGGDLGLACRFSDPDGVRTGKSGYSFGVCQFDLQNNVNALRCLADCGFAPREIAALVLQTISRGEVAALERKLVRAEKTITQWDASEIEHSIQHVRDVIRLAGLTLADRETFYHLVDYHNQFSMHRNGKCVLYMAQITGPIGAGHVLAYKLSTLWGRKRPDDVERRWQNIVRICRGLE